MEERQPSEKFTEIINAYKARNEKMKKELEVIRSQDEEERKKRNAEVQQHDALVKELATLKKALEVKDRALVKHQLEAALHSKAISMTGTNSVYKLLKAGSVKKLKKAGKSKKSLKWVEIYVNGAVVTESDITKGHLMLSYADNKDSQLANRCRVLRINVESKSSAKLKGKILSVDVMVSGRENELVFVCEDEKELNSWVQALNDGFKEIEREFKILSNLNIKTYLEVEFSKNQLGFRVEEKLLEVDVEIEEEKFTVGDKPCELVVTHIYDDDLHAKDVTVDCIVSAINGTNLRGLTYKKQLDFLSGTKKPFTLTFIKENPDGHAAYPRILEELVANDDNAVKSVFYDLVKGSPFGKELDESANKTTTIAELLSNQQRLATLLYSTGIKGSVL